MITKIELGSFNRNASCPILLKKKIESDGNLSIRIYQRKDIDSINSFKDKITTIVKYGIEDFCMAHQTFRPLLGTLGVKGIDHLKTNDLQNAQDLLQSIRSEARTGKVPEEKEIKLKQILKNHGLLHDYEIYFFEGQYKDADFFSDLKKFISLDNKFSKSDEESLNDMEIAFKSKKIISLGERRNQSEIIIKIKNNLNEHFKKQINLASVQSVEGTNSSETRSSESRLSDLNALKEELERKLNEIHDEVVERSKTPKDEEIKNCLFSFLEDKLEDEKCGEDWANALKTEAEIRSAINILFSTSWWISEERKTESLKKVQDFFKSDELWLPDPVRNRIYGSA